MAEIPPEVYDAATDAWIMSLATTPRGSSYMSEARAAAVDAVWPIAVAEGRRQAAEAIRAQADDVPFIPLRNGTRLKANSTVEWAATIAEGTDG